MDQRSLFPVTLTHAGMHITPSPSPQDVFNKLSRRYLLAGAVPEWNRSVEYPMRLLIERRQVALEVLWYIGVRGPLLSLFVLTDIDCRAGTTRSPYR